jgi:hypothetical protein
MKIKGIVAKHYVRVMALVAFAAGVTPITGCSTSTDVHLEEVIITASRRDAFIEDAAMSIAALLIT